ncbi:MAG: hypothetical protein GF308_08605 [Candidatus Heimdallarchaeota archaeon]|nr:hypothetical protein [Candidatus Heimdallarchaeota archaeon]
MTERDPDSLLYALLQDLHIDERAISVLKNTSKEEPLTVRELSNKTKMNVSRIYKDIRTLENLRLIKKIEGRPLKVIKDINEQMLEELALRARQKLLEEIEDRLNVIQAFVGSDVKKDLCKDCLLKPEIKVEQQEKGKDQSLTHFITLPPIEVLSQSTEGKRISGSKELMEILIEILQQEQLNLIVPFDEFTYIKQDMINSITNTIISDSNFTVNLNRLRILLFSKESTIDFDLFITQVTDALKLVLQKTKNIEIRLTNKFMYPTISNEKLVLMPIMCPNLELISHIIFTKLSSMINMVSSQFHQNWIKAPVIKVLSGKQYKEYLNQLSRVSS